MKISATKTLITACLTMALAAFVPAAFADTQVDITGFTKSNNIYTNLNQQFPNTGAGTPGSGAGVANAAFLYSPSTYTSANAVANSNLANNGVNFLLTSDATGKDFTEIGAGSIPGSFTIPINLMGVTSFHTLMAAYNTATVNVTFTGVSGATETFSNIFLPDFNGGGAMNQSSVVNGSTTNNLFDQTVFQVMDVGAGGTGNSATGAVNTYDLVEQSYVLNATLAGQQLSSVTITTNGGVPLLLGATAIVPEPSTFWLAGLSGAALLLFRRQRGVNTARTKVRQSVGVLLLCCTALSARGDVYVADNSLGELLDYTAANTEAVIDPDLVLPNAVLLDASGNVYVSNNSNGTIYKYAPGGAKSIYASGFGTVGGLVFDGAGNLYVSNYNAANAYGTIAKVTPTGVQSTFAGGLTRTRGLAFDGAGNLYQADLDSGNIYKYTPAGARSTFAGGFNYPTGIAFDASGNLYVCSQGTAVFKISPAGVVSTFTSNVTDPRGVAIDAPGNVYVTDVGDASGDPGQGNVYLFTPDGVRSTFASNLAGPLGIAITGAASLHPAFFSGETALSNGVYYLSFPGGNYFGYYSYLSDPKYIYHFDLGYEYVFDAADGKGGVYFYDFASSTFFYTSPTFPFPYLYDFSLNTVLYYYPDPNDPGRYNTDGVRYFYDFATGKIITK